MSNFTRFLYFVPNILARIVESRKIKIKPFKEDRSHRNNLRIDGVNEEKGETWEIKNIFQKKLEIQEDHHGTCS